MFNLPHFFLVYPYRSQPEHVIKPVPSTSVSQLLGQTTINHHRLNN
jgi:hypothetical protein